MINYQAERDSRNQGIKVPVRTMAIMMMAVCDKSVTGEIKPCMVIVIMTLPVNFMTVAMTPVIRPVTRNLVRWMPVIPTAIPLIMIPTIASIIIGKMAVMMIIMPVRMPP